MATPEQVLKDACFAERLAEIEARVTPTLALAAKESSLAKRNQARRKLYHDSELLRIELEEKMNELGIENLWLTASEMREANEKLDAVRNQLHLETLSASKSPFELVYMVVRLATLVLLLVGWFSAITMLIPLKLLNPVLQQLGVKKNYFPMDILSWTMANLLCIASCTDFTAEGQDNIGNINDAVVCMFSHASNLDGFIANAASPTALRFAGKKSLFMIPCLGWAARWGFDFVAIDRGNRSSALKSLKHLAYSVNERGYSVCISPEGTRSKDGLLQEFKKGPFYLREDINKNVVPAIVFGAYELWPPGRLFALPGKALIRFLPEYKTDPSKNRNQNRLALRRIFLKAFTEDVPDDIGTHVDLNSLLKNMAAIYLIWAITFKFMSLAMSLIATVCFWLNISYWTFSKLALVTAVAGEALMFFTC